MKSAITVSLVPEAAGGPFVFWDDLEAAFALARSIGFDALEVFPRSAAQICDQAPWFSAKYGVPVAAVGSGAGWVCHKWHLCHADETARGNAVQFIGEIVDTAADLKAPAIIGSMQGRVIEESERPLALDRLAESLAILSGRAAERGQYLLYEPLNRYETNLFNRLEDAASFLEERSLHSVKLLADLFHMNIEEPSIPDALRTAASWIGHVHFADSNRRAIGYGHSNIAPVVQALREVGYEGYLSAEILPWPNSREAAEQTLRAFQAHVAAYQAC